MTTSSVLPDLRQLEARINEIFENEQTPPHEARDVLRAFRAAMNQGLVRVAAPESPAGEPGGHPAWTIHTWVKRGLLLHQMLGRLTASADEEGCCELDTLPRRRFELADRVRIPSAGCYIRDDAWLAPGVTCMPPTFVSIGAFVDEGSFLDSHTSVGLCAQIGKRVRLNAGAQIGGMIEPVEQLPNILCDDVIIGSNSGVYDGVYVSEGAVITAGVQVTRRSRLFDPGQRAMYKAAKGQPLVIPPRAVVIAGAVPVSKKPLANGALFVQSLVVAGYRDDSSLSDDILAELID